MHTMTALQLAPWASRKREERVFILILIVVTHILQKSELKLLVLIPFLKYAFYFRVSLDLQQSCQDSRVPAFPLVGLPRC